MHRLPISSPKMKSKNLSLSPSWLADMEVTKSVALLYSVQACVYCTVWWLTFLPFFLDKIKSNPNVTFTRISCTNFFVDFFTQPLATFWGKVLLFRFHNAGDGIRTHTGTVLSRLPLPIGLPRHGREKVESPLVFPIFQTGLFLFSNSISLPLTGELKGYHVQSA